jgi:ankyrin repeat protein
MKHILITAIAAVVLVGCGEAGNPEADRALRSAANEGNIEAVKQHLAAGANVNTKSERGRTPLHYAARWRHKEIIELLISSKADVNAKDEDGDTPLDWAIGQLQTTRQNNTADLLRKHGGKTGEELKAEGK